MPAKKTKITDADRAKNMRALAREVGASDDPNLLEQALQVIGRRREEAPKPAPTKK